MNEPPSPGACPCGSDSFADCCDVLHRGRRSGSATAPTAERLMRSRFSAFAVGDADYLLATWHPTTRPDSVEFDPQIEWRRLVILGVMAGGADDVRGTVEFVAHYLEGGRREQLRENSLFVRERDQWFYVEPVDTD